MRTDDVYMTLFTTVDQLTTVTPEIDALIQQLADLVEKGSDA